MKNVGFIRSERVITFAEYPTFGIAVCLSMLPQSSPTLNRSEQNFIRLSSCPHTEFLRSESSLTHLNSFIFHQSTGKISADDDSSGAFQLV